MGRGALLAVARRQQAAAQRLRHWNQIARFQKLTDLSPVVSGERWFEWVPDAGLVEAPGRGEMHIVAVRIPNRKAILVYFPAKRHAAIKLPDSMRDATLALTWFDPASGERVLQEAPSSSRRMTLTPPDAFEDAVVVLAPKDAE